MLYCHVTTQRNLLYSFQLASKFNTEIYKNAQTSDSVLRPMPGLRPWTHWGLLYSKPHETAPKSQGVSGPPMAKTLKASRRRTTSHSPVDHFI